MQSRRNPWIGFLYGLAAAVLIAAIYLVPRKWDQPARFLSSISEALQSESPSEAAITAAPENLIPVAAETVASGKSGHPQAPNDEAPSSDVDAKSKATTAGTSLPADPQALSAPPNSVRGKPIVTDRSVVADN